MPISLCLNGIFRSWGESLASKHICIFSLLMKAWFMSQSQDGSFGVIFRFLLVCSQCIWGCLVNSTSTFVNELIFMMETGLDRAMRMVVCERIWLGTDIPCPLTACVVLCQLLEHLRACFCLTAEWVDFRNLLMLLRVWHSSVCEELRILSCQRRCSIYLISNTMDYTISEPSIKEGYREKKKE